MDPLWWRTFSYVIVFIGTGLVLVGSIGTWYFGSLVEQVAPYRQPIRSASVTVEVFFRSNDAYDNWYIDRGGYLAFGRGTEALLTTGAAQSLGKQQGDGRVLFRGVFDMDATDRAVGRPVSDLRQAEFVQIEFHQMPNEAHVLGGRAVVTLNSAVRIEFDIPEQDIRDGRIFVRNLATAFRNFR